ncbi:MAG: tetratricopeptide repeat protein [Paracoccaceae bacterium]
MGIGPRRRAAVLFADIHHYSSLLELNEPAALERSERATTLLTSLVDDLGGIVDHVSGDGVLAVFETAADALSLAVGFQREMANDRVWNPERLPIAFRIGISVGEVVETPSGAHGRTLVVAARLQQMARPGGILVTGAIQEEAGAVPGASFRRLGKKRLRNLSTFVDVSEVLVDNALPASGIFVDEQTERTRARYANALAVLNLVDPSADPANAHLCSGLTSDIISNLTRFRDLHVIAHRSSSLFDGARQPLDEIAELLGVAYLVCGSLLRDGHRIRLHIELVAAGTGGLLWSERFDATLGDVFAIGDELTAQIAGRLSNEIASAELRRITTSPPEHLQAYGLLLRGKAVYRQVSRFNNLHAKRLLEQAKELDPGFARSYAGVSRVLNDAWRYRWLQPPETILARALAEAEQAVRLDPSDARGHAALGSVRLYLRHHESALAAFERALALNPNDADVLAEMGHSVCVNDDPDRAIGLIETAMSLNPYHPDWYLWHLGEAYFDKADYARAITTLNRMQDRTEAHRILTASYALSGEREMAVRSARELLLSQPDFSLSHWRDVPPDRNPEPRERLIDGLRLAGLE